MTISTLNIASHDEGGDWIEEEGPLTPLAPQVTIFCAVIYAHSISGLAHLSVALGRQQRC